MWGFDVGVDDYLIKLFVFVELVVWLCVLSCWEVILVIEIEIGEFIIDF